MCKANLKDNHSYYKSWNKQHEKLTALITFQIESR